MDLTNKDFLGEIGRGAIIAFLSIILGTVLKISFSYLVIFLASPVLYGLFSILDRIYPILTRTTGGLQSALYRTIPRLEKDEQNAVITAAIILSLLISILLVLGIVFGIDILIKNTSLDKSHSLAIIIFALHIPFIILIRIISAIFKSYKRIGLANIISTISEPVSRLTGAVIGLFFVAKTLFGLWLGVMISIVFLLISSVWLLFRYTDYEVVSPLSARSVVYEFCVYSRDSSIGTLAAIAQYQGVFILMSLVLQPLEAGLFSLGVLIVGIIRWPLSAVNQIFPPIMTDLYNNNEMEELNNLYKQTTRLLLYCIIPFLSLIIIYPKTILSTFSNAYVSDFIVLQVLAIGQAVAVIIGSVGLLLVMTDHQTESMWLQIIIDIIFVPIGAFISFKYGLIGLSVMMSGLLIINNTLELLLLYIKTELFPFTLSHLKILGTGITVFGSFIIINPPNIVFSITLFTIVCIFYYVFTYQKILHEEEKMIILNISQTLKKVI